MKKPKRGSYKESKAIARKKRDLMGEKFTEFLEEMGIKVTDVTDYRLKEKQARKND